MLALLDKLENLVSIKCNLEFTRNALDSVSVYNNSTKFYDIDFTIERINLEIKIIKEFILTNSNLRDLVKVKAVDNSIDVRILDLRVRSSIYTRDAQLEEFLVSYEFFMFLFSDGDAICIDANIKFCKDLQRKFRGKFSRDFDEFTKSLENSRVVNTTKQS